MVKLRHGEWWIRVSMFDAFLWWIIPSFKDTSTSSMYKWEFETWGFNRCETTQYWTLDYSWSWSNLGKILTSTLRLIYLSIQITIFKCSRYSPADNIDWHIESLLKLDTSILNWHEQLTMLGYEFILKSLRTKLHLHRLRMFTINWNIIDGNF